MHMLSTSLVNLELCANDVIGRLAYGLFSGILNGQFFLFSRPMTSLVVDYFKHAMPLTSFVNYYKGSHRPLILKGL
jgi:hypothetical protein